MSSCPGNPYIESLAEYADARNSLEAMATLALAYEQRTANLVAYWDKMSAGDELWANTPFQRGLDDMHRDIRTRLGRTPEVPK